MTYKLRRKSGVVKNGTMYRIPDIGKYWRCAHCNILYCPNEEVLKSDSESFTLLCPKCLSCLGWGTRAFFENLFIFKILPNNHV